MSRNELVDEDSCIGGVLRALKIMLIFDTVSLYNWCAWNSMKLRDNSNDGYYFFPDDNHTSCYVIRAL